MSTYRTYAEKLKDPKWQKRRLEILNRDKFTCQCCRDTETTLHVHHLQYFNGDPWDVEDIYLITLCEFCHEEEERLKSIDVLGKMFSKYGVTRKQLLRLLEHCAYALEMSEPKDRERFDPLGPLFNKLVDPDDLTEYSTWLLKKGGRFNG